MFYSENILAKRGPLAKVWLAAHWERKLSKTQFLQANIPSSISAIVEDYGQPMALRLSGQLLLGVVRIFSRKTRYLLEDCSEALVKIKMAFRPGLVDLTDEQAVANTGLITIGDSINEFDMLMPDPVLDLNTLLNSGSTRSNTSRLQDITLQPDFLSFSQPIPDDLDQLGLNTSRNFGLNRIDQDMSIEVGRDAVTGREFTPGLDVLSVAGSVREKSVGPTDPLLGGDLSFELGLGGDPQFNEDFDFTFDNLDALAPAAEEPIKTTKIDFGGADFNDDYGPIDDFHPKEESLFAVEESLEPFPYDIERKSGIPKPTKKRKASVPKKQMFSLIDEKIELSSEYLRTQLNNPHLNSGKENFVPVSRLLVNLDEKKKKWLSIEVPAYFIDIERKIQNQTTGNAREISFHKDESFNDDYGDFNFDVSLLEANGSKRTKIQTEDNIENENEDVMNESIVFGGVAATNDQFDYDFTAADEFQEGKDIVETDLSANSTRTLSVIKDKILESSSKHASFNEMTFGASRPVAAKLFFEILALQSKSMIRVCQESAYSDILVSV